MKAKNLLLLTLTLFCMGTKMELSAQSQSGQQNNLGKVLILYYSFSDNANTEKVTKIIQSLTGGDIRKIELEAPLPTLSYRAFTEWVKEQQEKKNYPAIRPLGVDIAAYDFIIIGTPSWWHTLSLPIVTLLKQTDFAGKPVTIFGTHQGNGSKIIGDFSALVKNGKIVQGELFGNVAGDRRIKDKVSQWVGRLRR
jgi:flavodoxin